MVGPEFARSDRVRLVMPARAGPAVARHMSLDRPKPGRPQRSQRRSFVPANRADLDGWPASRDSLPGAP